MADFELLKAWGVAGREKRVRAVILRELEGLARTCVCGAENPPETGFCRTCGRPL